MSKSPHIIILGAGRSGQAAARLAKKAGGRALVLDSGDEAKLMPARDALVASGIPSIMGSVADHYHGPVDQVVVSPGIDLNWQIARQFRDRGVPVIGEIEFAFTQCSVPVIAVTGTNGKTTTTELITEILQGCGEKAVAAGNIGRAFSEVILEEKELGVIVLEVSSFQLEAIETFQPDISVWTNFAADHLDRYDGIESYRAAKLRIFEKQTARDFGVINARDVNAIGEIAAHQVTFSAGQEADYTLKGGSIHYQGEPLLGCGDMLLRGSHNMENLMAALAACRLRGHDFETMLRAVSKYTPPAHRCELVGSINSSECINDSKATNLHALENSLNSQPGKVVLIAGGKQKGLDYAPLKETVGRMASHVVTLGEIGEDLAALWGGVVPCEVASDMEVAVALASQAAARGQTILFSPGTSSFDMFSGYEERGNAFRLAVNKLGNGSGTVHAQNQPT